MDIKTKLILNAVIPVVNQVINQMLSQENYERCMDALFDFLEDIVKRSENTIDDKTFLPVISTLRTLLGVVDKPDSAC